MTDNTLTPFEQAELNSKILPARMALCSKVQDMVQILVEIQKLRDLPEGSLMLDPEILKIAEEEENKIMSQLTVMADIWQKADGVSA